jgi:hypothetical protein
VTTPTSGAPARVSCENVGANPRALAVALAWINLRGQLWMMNPGRHSCLAMREVNAPVVDVVSVYGPVNAGVRARALEWLRRLDTPGRLTSYFGQNAAGATMFLRNPATAFASERQLASLTRQRPATLFLSREASPLSRGRPEERLLGSAAHGVYDIDDALHDVVQRFPLDPLFSKSAKATRAARAADVVIAGNEYLAGWANELNREVRIIPTCVEPANYARKLHYDMPEIPRIVWLGTPSGERYLLGIASALLEVHHRVGARLILVGAGSRPLGPLDVMTDRIPWSLEFVQTQLCSFDVGIMPLQDTAYERGKCAYKLLEYGAAGLPVVASPVGVNGSILTRSSAPAPLRGEDWADALSALLMASSRERESQAGRQLELIANEYSFARWLPAWKEAVLP